MFRIQDGEEEKGMTGRYGSQPTHLHFLNPLQLSSELSLSLSVSHFEADTPFNLEGRELLVSTPMVKYPLFNTEQKIFQ
jgi:hypothetical protein